MAKLILSIILVLSFQNIMSQGRLLIAGGGTEREGNNSWSTPAYKWAAQGKRVAIIGTSTGTLDSYFRNPCGAKYAKEFAVSSRLAADNQALHDTLITYDVIFFRGGNQSNYYNYYKDTRLLDAVMNVYSRGGTIGGTSAGMHILSSVVFTALNGTAYSHECLEDPFNNYVELADDFLNLVPDFIFDTHFAERGRFGRLLGFMANHYLSTGKKITGLGMDDLTCMTIDQNGLGTVYGTGCANIYIPVGTFSLNGEKLLADSVRAIQLLQGCTYNFITGEVNAQPMNVLMNTSEQWENGKFTILASGNKNALINDDLIEDLVNKTGQRSSPVLILTGDAPLASVFRSKILAQGASSADIKMINTNSGNDTELRQMIQGASKIMLLSIATNTFLQFLQSPNGIILKEKLMEDGMISAFIGDDARFAGKTVVGNFYSEDASYYGELTFHEGMGLLEHTVIMANTYFNEGMYENTATAVPYAMVKDNLKFGVWLNAKNYMKFTQENGKNYIFGYGISPVIVIQNEGSRAGHSRQTNTGSTSISPRMVAGFEKMKLVVTDYTNPFEIGKPGTTGTSFFETLDPVIIPNPVRDIAVISLNTDSFSWELFDIKGMRLLSGDMNKIDVSDLKPGLYIVKLTDKSSGKSESVKLIVD